MAAPAGDKPFLTMQAQCMLVGAVLEKSTDDRDQRLFVLTRGAVTLRLKSLADVEAWLRLRHWCLERAA